MQNLEHFINWQTMNTGFKWEKLWGRFEQPLANGNYSLLINNSKYTVILK